MKINIRLQHGLADTWIVISVYETLAKNKRLYDSVRLKPKKATVASYTNFLSIILPEMQRRDISGITKIWLQTASLNNHDNDGSNCIYDETGNSNASILAHLQI